MNDQQKKNDLQEAQARFRRFLAGETDAREFRYPICHPSAPTGFCGCNGTRWGMVKFYVRAAVMQFVLKSPFYRLKVWLLRRVGAKVGRNVHISEGVHIDPLFPQLLTIEDNVLIGMEAKLVMHAFTTSEFRAGTITIRRGTVVGGFSLVGPGVEIGEGAMVAAGAAVGRDVPAGATAIGNVAKNIMMNRPLNPSCRTGEE